MRELTVPTWVPPAATAALNKVWNDASLDLDDKARTVLRRLASDRAMHEVWLKLPAERALGAESLLRGAIAYAHWGFELRYSPLRPGDPTPWPISHLAIGHTQFLLATMRVMARSDIAEEAWTRVRGEDCAFDFKTLVAAVEKLPQFYELLDQWDARVFDTLPTVARPKSKGARLQFFCRGMERQLRGLYGKPLYPVIAILAQMVFALPQALDPGTVKQICKRK